MDHRAILNGRRAEYETDVVGDVLSAQITLWLDLYAGQAPVVTALLTLTCNLDLRNKRVHNLHAIRQAACRFAEGFLHRYHTGKGRR